MLHKAGEVWHVSTRKGNLTIKLLEDVDPRSDCFFRADVIEGKSPGFTDLFRTSMTCFVMREENL